MKEHKVKLDRTDVSMLTVDVWFYIERKSKKDRGKVINVGTNRPVFTM